MGKHAGFIAGLVSLCSVLGGAPRAAHAQDFPAGQTPIVEGYISAISSDTAFSVGSDTQYSLHERHVVITPQTVFWRHTTQMGQDVMTDDPNVPKVWAVGDEVQVFGRKDKHLHAIVAEQVLVRRRYEHIKGFAVVQRVMARSPRLVVEADGYYIVIPHRVAVKGRSPLSGQIPRVNEWINYSGRFDRAGFVVVHRIAVSKFALSKRLRKGLTKSKGKLTAPAYGNGAGGDGKDGEIAAPYIFGRRNTARIPADWELQQQVQDIGERLIPACQRRLAANDPQKIDFRFYVVDDKSYFQNIGAAIGSPDGIVIIPEQTIARLRNDDQIAAILAQGVAEALEWQVPPSVVGANGPALIEAAQMAGPYAGLALSSIGLYEMLHGKYPVRYDPLQTERVALSLVHDAGYDVRQAPVALQILDYRDAKHPLALRPPLQSMYLSNLVRLEYEHNLKAQLREAVIPLQ
jgi:hypothetical protein